MVRQCPLRSAICAALAMTLCFGCTNRQHGFDGVRVSIDRLGWYPRVDKNKISEHYWVPEDSKEKILFISERGEGIIWDAGKPRQFYCTLSNTQIRTVAFDEEGNDGLGPCSVQLIGDDRMKVEGGCYYVDEGIWRRAKVKPTILGWEKP